jgi:TPR repeat protein
MKKRFALAVIFCLPAMTALADDSANCDRHFSSGNHLLAVQPCTSAAEQGDARAQFKLGWMYERGLGVPQDNAEAVRWYRAAAEQGNTSAQSNLGFMYQRGLGVPQDYAEAVRWYRAAAEQGNTPGRSSIWA